MGLQACAREDFRTSTFASAAAVLRSPTHRTVDPPTTERAVMVATINFKINRTTKRYIEREADSTWTLWEFDSP